MQGTITKGIGGFYYVKTEDGIYQCKARGIFKKEGLTPTVGDRVELKRIETDSNFMETEDAAGEGVITGIVERKNSFVRPPVANVDCFIITLAATHPAPNLFIIDKFLVMAEKSRTDIVLCVNKADLASPQEIQAIKDIYDAFYPVVIVSGKTGEGTSQLQDLITGKKSAFAGPSGVGKSTILNQLAPAIEAETGDISKKTKRGKHTTRHAELFDLGNETLLFDTPGFTSFEILEAEEEELQFLYPEMTELIGNCKYDNCRHRKEPGCAIRQAVEDGKIAPSRHESYLAQLTEIIENNKY